MHGTHFVTNWGNVGHADEFTPQDGVNPAKDSNFYSYSLS